DRTRKEILVDFGFRLPSALDNRPLTFEEFEGSVHQAIYMSATPGPYELERSERIVQQLIRPTGVVAVIGVLWCAAKVFRIGLLMYGKPPDFATMIRWIRAA